ncbi:hypothetical protein BDV96DRAFT_567815 [Lophiotrema nucula]|uniref:Uncharacterized protein n=1 Tax=Lophiotrema nucula TaxID=690887 RepID=A0A6A5ZM84_9PLEO|nr:hypothetical protein BDV96DRAFT_567815 [Lophiotrema nucula]
MYAVRNPEVSPYVRRVLAIEHPKSDSLTTKRLAVQSPVSRYEDWEQSLVKSMQRLQGPTLTKSFLELPESTDDIAELEYNRIAKFIDTIFQHDSGEHRKCRRRDECWLSEMYLVLTQGVSYMAFRDALALAQKAQEAGDIERIHQIQGSMRRRWEQTPVYCDEITEVAQKLSDVPTISDEYAHLNLHYNVAEYRDVYDYWPELREQDTSSYDHVEVNAGNGYVPSKSVLISEVNAGEEMDQS